MRRASTDLSLLLGVNKPCGMSSHDVVNEVRRIFGERRVGHMGTLDPLASGVLPICVGPATRLDNHLTGQRKRYRFRVCFGTQTSTDDAEGEVVARGSAPAHLFDERFAASYIEELVGEHDQVPPAYSAIKVNGTASYVRARKGETVELGARRITVYEARLASIGEDDATALPWWDVEVLVSKGTYIRSLARDIGRDLGCPAHVGSLLRLASGRITLEECYTLDSLNALKTDAALDPVRVLGCRFAFADRFEAAVRNGNRLAGEKLEVFEPLPAYDEAQLCACSSSIERSERALEDGELIALVSQNRLSALYTYHAHDDVLSPSCVFSIGVLRG